MLDSGPRTILMTADTVGGVWTYALELVRGLTEGGINVILATMGDPMSAAQREEAALIRGLRIIESTYKLEWMHEPWADVDAAGQWLLELEHRYNPDIIHLNGYAHGALPWRAPALVVAHSCVLSWWRAVKGEEAPSSWNEYQRRVADGLRHASMVVAPTQAMLDAVDEHYGPLPLAQVVHNGRSPILFTSRSEKQHFIFAAGRLGDEAKNIQALGEAAQGLAWPVFVAGAEQDASGTSPLPGNVTPCGKLAPTAVADKMAASAIYCLPARYEPFGLSILEAALSGCALVLGDIPSLRELWDGCAFFVPPDDPTAIRKALQDLIAAPDRRIQLSEAARTRGQTFSHDKFIEAYREIYHHLLTTQYRRQSIAA